MNEHTTEFHVNADQEPPAETVELLGAVASQIKERFRMTNKMQICDMNDGELIEYLKEQVDLLSDIRRAQGAMIDKLQKRLHLTAEPGVVPEILDELAESLRNKPEGWNNSHERYVVISPGDGDSAWLYIRDTLRNELIGKSGILVKRQLLEMLMFANAGYGAASVKAAEPAPVESVEKQIARHWANNPTVLDELAESLQQEGEDWDDDDDDGEPEVGEKLCVPTCPGILPKDEPDPPQANLWTAEEIAEAKRRGKEMYEQANQTADEPAPVKAGEPVVNDCLTTAEPPAQAVGATEGTCKQSLQVGELLPCPFCGQPGPEVVTNLSELWVECRRCKCRGPQCGTKSFSIESWNRRTAERELAELKQAMENGGNRTFDKQAKIGQALDRELIEKLRAENASLRQQVESLKAELTNGATITAHRKLRDDNGPSLVLGEPEQFVSVQGRYYPVNWIVGGQGLIEGELEVQS